MGISPSQPFQTQPLDEKGQSTMKQGADRRRMFHVTHGHEVPKKHERKNQKQLRGRYK